MHTHWNNVIDIAGFAIGWLLVLVSKYVYAVVDEMRNGRHGYKCNCKCMEVVRHYHDELMPFDRVDHDDCGGGCGGCVCTDNPVHIVTPGDAENPGTLESPGPDRVGRRDA